MIDSTFNREKELTDIINQLSLGAKGQIIYVYGEHHIGKTVLREKLECRLYENPMPFPNQKIRFATFDFRKDKINEFEIVNYLYKNILSTWENIQFPRYEIARLYLNQKTGYTHENYALESSEWTDAFEILFSILKETLITAKALSGNILLTEFLKNIPTLPLSKKINDIINLINTKFRLVKAKDFLSEIEILFYNRSDQDIVDKLTDFFLSDLEAYCINNFSNIHTIILDTFEKCSNNNIKNHWFYRKLILPSQNLHWVIFGTEQYAFNNTDERIIRALTAPIYSDDFCWGKPISGDYIWIMKRFNKETSEEYIDKRNIKNKDVAEKIIELSQGLPGALGILCDAYAKISQNGTPTMADFNIHCANDDFYRQILDIYLQNSSEYEKNILKFLSIFEIWNKDIFDFFAEKQSIPYSNKEFEKIIKLSFIQEFSPSEYIIIDLPREALKCTLNKIEQKEYYRIASKFFNEHSDNLLLEWTSSENLNYELYSSLKSSALDAVKFGINDYQSNEDFNTFSSWFIKKNDNKEGFEQRLSSVYLYDLKSSVLRQYLANATDKGYFAHKSVSAYHLQAYYDLSWAYIFMHSYTEAVDSICKTLSLSLSYGIDSCDERVIKCIYSLGVIFQRWGKYEDSEFWHSVALKQRELNENKEVIAFSLNALADAKMNNIKNRDRFTQAEALFESCLEIKERLFKNAVNDISRKKSLKAKAITIGNMSKLYFLWGCEDKDPEKIKIAIQREKECIDIISSMSASKKDLQPYTIRVLTGEFELARINCKVNVRVAELYKNRFEDFEKDWLADMKTKSDFTHNLINTRNNLAVVYAYMNKVDQAVELLEKNINSRTLYKSSYNEKNVRICENNLQIMNNLLPKYSPEDLDSLTLIY